MVVNITLVDRVKENGYSKRIREAIKRGNLLYNRFSCYNVDAPLYFVKSINAAVNLFAKDEDNNPIVPVFFNEESPAFAYVNPFTGKRLAVIVKQNITKEPVLVKNLEAICAHEIGEVVLRDYNEEFKTFKKIIGDYCPHPWLSDITNMVYELRADKGVINMGYKEQLLELRTLNAEELEKETKVGAFELPAVAAFKLLEKNGVPPPEVADKLRSKLQKTAEGRTALTVIDWIMNSNKGRYFLLGGI